MGGCCAAQQNVNFRSTDNNVFLVVTPTGNIVLYDGNCVNNYPSSPSCVIWQSGTASTAAPFYLTMQDVSPGPLDCRVPLARQASCLLPALMGSHGDGNSCAM
jgi:hypothetical protein